MVARAERKVLELGRPGVLGLTFPKAFTHGESLQKGDRVSVFFDQGLLVVASPGREALADRVLRSAGGAP